MAAHTKLLTRTGEVAFCHHCCDGGSRMKKLSPKLPSNLPKIPQQAAEQGFRLESPDSKFKAVLSPSVSC